MTALLAAFAWFLGSPLVTLLHELGHALLALRFSSDLVVVELGKAPWGWQWQVGRLRFRAAWNFIGWGGVVGLCRWDSGSVTHPQRIAVALAGPAVTLSALLILSALSLVLRGDHLWLQPVSNILALVAFVQLIFTLPPIRYPQWPPHAGRSSDGLTALTRWRAWRRSG